MLDRVREILTNSQAPRAQILAVLADLECAEAAACAEIDALREKRCALLLDGDDQAIDAVEQVRRDPRLERIEVAQAALYERLERLPARAPGGPAPSIERAWA